jgi:acyl-CoA thioester hydrolase
MDAIGHVNNAKYFTYCESARIEYFDQINVGRLGEATSGPALVQATLNFRRQVSYPSVLDVGISVPEVRTRSFRMDYGIFFEATDTLVADGTSVVAWADYRAGRAVEVPETVRTAIDVLEGRKTLS